MGISTSSPLDLFMHESIKTIDTHFEKLLEPKALLLKNLINAARYSIFSGGKRLRPLLMLAVAESFNLEKMQVLDAACAIEMIHTYSLIHDDLPCMDDDDFRRGKPSLHKAFSEAEAVLTGDYLLTYAFEILATSPHLKNEEKIPLIQLISKASGANGMIGGQILDIEAEGKLLNLEDLKNIHLRKTGALIEASILAAAIVGKASEEELFHLQSFAKKLGLSFQIIDDVLDITTQKNSDSKNAKATYASLLGLDKATDLAYNYLDEALIDLDKLNRETTLLKELAKLLINRNR